MPLFASRSEASTSCVLLPMDETMPIPVTTTRRMFSLLFPALHFARISGADRRRVLEQTDLHVADLVDDLVVSLEPAIGDTEHKLGAHHTFEFDTVYKFFYARHDLAGKFDFTNTERAAAAFGTGPAEKKSDELP